MLEHMDLKGIYTTFHKTAEYTIFSNTYRTIFRRDHVLGYKKSLDKINKPEKTTNIFPDHTGMNIGNKRFEIHKHTEIKQPIEAIEATNG